jgi:YesN/AraC family two-component response regulator
MYAPVDNTRCLLSVPARRVAGEAADGREAIEAAVRVHPDVVVLDIRMPVLDGMEAT